MEHRSDVADRGKAKYRGINLTQCSFSTTNLTWTDVGSKVGLRGNKLEVYANIIIIIIIIIINKNIKHVH